MSALPILSGENCIQILCGGGYVVTRQKGSHVRLICAGRPPVTVPLHAELDRGTLRAIIRTTGMSIDEFIGLKL